MSFGLLTALNIEDVPKILQRVAASYRSVETRRYPELWEYAATLLDEAAAMMNDRINTEKATNPEFKRSGAKRIRL